MKNTTIYNALKGRADAFGGILVQETGYTCPVLIDDVSRDDIENDPFKASELLRQRL